MAILLQDNTYLIKHFKPEFKYGSGLIIISPIENIDWGEVIWSNGKINRDLLSQISFIHSNKPQQAFVRGNYFTSNKGNKCFKINPQGKHCLTRGKIGGSFSNIIARDLEVSNTLYSKINMSNGGRLGWIYQVLEWGKDYYSPYIDF